MSWHPLTGLGQQAVAGGQHAVSTHGQRAVVNGQHAVDASSTWAFLEAPLILYKGGASPKALTLSDSCTYVLLSVFST